MYTLIYQGTNGAHLAGVPARNIPQAEAEARGWDPAVLLGSGLYRLDGSLPAAPAAGAAAVPAPGAHQTGPLSPEMLDPAEEI